MVPAFRTKAALVESAAALAQRFSEGLLRERIIPRFVDSYVIEHGRIGLQVHASLYRDLLALLQREALLAMSARGLEIAITGNRVSLKKKLPAMSRKDASTFRQTYLMALSRQQKWNAGDALAFQSDLLMYEAILARAATPRRSRKPFEVANHPFVDRCAFLLDSSFLDKARVAASRALTDLENLTLQITEKILPNPTGANVGLPR